MFFPLTRFYVQTSFFSFTDKFFYEIVSVTMLSCWKVQPGPTRGVQGIYCTRALGNPSSGGPEVRNSSRTKSSVKLLIKVY